MKIIVILLLFMMPIAHADWKDISSMEFTVQAFPSDDTEDIKRLFELEKSRSNKDCALARKQRFPGFATFFKGTEIMDIDDFELTQPLFAQVTEFTERVTKYYKDKFDRPRPFAVHKRLKPCADKPTGAKSYPSSHASVATASACLLVEVFPDKKEDLEAWALHVSELRAVVGVHYPSDVVAGQKLGSDICARLMQESDFRKEIEELKARARAQRAQ